jgi:hypothetical protein
MHTCSSCPSLQPREFQGSNFRLTSYITVVNPALYSLRTGKHVSVQTTRDLEKASPEDYQNSSAGTHRDVSYASVTAPSRRLEEEEEEEITRIPTRTSQTPRIKQTIVGLAKTITTRSNASVIDPGPPPDGGTKAWIQAVMVRNSHVRTACEIITDFVHQH